jgi:hypothetical protein
VASILIHTWHSENTQSASLVPLNNIPPSPTSALESTTSVTPSRPPGTTSAGPAPKDEKSRPTATSAAATGSNVSGSWARTRVRRRAHSKKRSAALSACVRISRKMICFAGVGFSYAWTKARECRTLGLVAEDAARSIEMKGPGMMPVGTEVQVRSVVLWRDG